MDSAGYEESKSRLFQEDNSIDVTNSSDDIRISNKMKVCIFVISILFIFLFKTFLFRSIVVSGESMLPNYRDEEVLILRTGHTELERGDIIVARVNGKQYIKRIVGLPSETLQIIDGYIYINGDLLEEPYTNKTTEYGIAKEQIVIPDNCYFVMGDNRDNSKDSRMFGAIERKCIIGKAILKIFPFWEVERIEN